MKKTMKKFSALLAVVIMMTAMATSASAYVYKSEGNSNYALNVYSWKFPPDPQTPLRMYQYIEGDANQNWVWEYAGYGDYYYLKLANSNSYITMIPDSHALVEVYPKYTGVQALHFDNVATSTYVFSAWNGPTRYVLTANGYYNGAYITWSPYIHGASNQRWRWHGG